VYLTNKLEHLEKKKAQSRRTTLSAELANHGERPGGVWSAMSREKKPRDIIHQLKVPKTNPPQYECNTQKMANLARRYHKDLQLNDLENQNQHEFDVNITLVLNKIHQDQILKEPEATKMYEQVTEAQVKKAIHLSKNKPATGMDRCPYELWKTLREWHNQDTPKNKHTFNIAHVLMTVYTDIQQHSIDDSTDFMLGWMCPIYKKKDRTDISNYRPITLLNTDYKMLTKVLAIQLMEHITSLVHKDQAGFIPKRSIFDHSRMSETQIEWQRRGHLLRQWRQTGEHWEWAGMKWWWQEQLWMMERLSDTSACPLGSI
jgi:Reverse transcriptase (RNA-dependent DNA polymerase)